jgi:CheY-like chemotaxis protein
MNVGGAQPVSPDPTLAGRTVLVVEDHEDSRELLVALLRWLRAHVITASTMRQAEDQVLMHRPDLIVCDLKLPDGTGLEFLARLRALLSPVRTTPCIAITGFADYFSPARARGFDAYLVKPVDLDKFCDLAVALTSR